MLQQTTVKAVIPYFLKFTHAWPRIEDLAAAPLEDVLDNWAGLGYYARARNLHKCAQYVVANHGGRFPEAYDALLTLPGIGPYTAGAIATIAFGRPAPVMDGNIERIVARLFCIQEMLPAAKPIYRSHVEQIFANDIQHPGDIAQALMDIGATICTPTAPQCMLCPLRLHCCAADAGTMNTYPRKAAKAPVPEKHAYVYIVRNAHGQIAAERRAAKGLLGGMLGLPTSDWVTIDQPLPDLEPGEGEVAQVRHVFTHFALTLHIVAADAHPAPANVVWMTMSADTYKKFPTLFAKVIRLIA